MIGFGGYGGQTAGQFMGGQMPMNQGYNQQPNYGGYGIQPSMGAQMPGFSSRGIRPKRGFVKQQINRGIPGRSYQPQTGQYNQPAYQSLPQQSYQPMQQGLLADVMNQGRTGLDPQRYGYLAPYSGGGF